MDALPREINRSNLDFHIDDLYTLKYPQDFKQLKYKRNGKESYSMALPTILDIKDPFTIDAAVAFDVNMADFHLELVKYDESDLADVTEHDIEPNYEIVELGSPLLNLIDNDDETFMRVIPETYVDPEDDEVESDSLKYMMLLQENQAFYIFD